MKLSAERERVLKEQLRILSDAYPVAAEFEREKLATLELIETGLRKLAKLRLDRSAA